ncbi:hypothetical protein ABBQ32_012301 [Trebouxia sp. C0010 RCD-2024]
MQLQAVGRQQAVALKPHSLCLTQKSTIVWVEVAATHIALATAREWVWLTPAHGVRSQESWDQQTILSKIKPVCCSRSISCCIFHIQLYMQLVHIDQSHVDMQLIAWQSRALYIWD